MQFCHRFGLEGLEFDGYRATFAGLKQMSLLQAGYYRLSRRIHLHVHLYNRSHPNSSKCSLKSIPFTISGSAPSYFKLAYEPFQPLRSSQECCQVLASLQTNKAQSRRFSFMVQQWCRRYQIRAVVFLSIFKNLFKTHLAIEHFLYQHVYRLPHAHFAPFDLLKMFKVSALCYHT